MNSNAMQQHEIPKHLGRTPCCSKIGLNRGPWTPDEDLLLTKCIQAFGEGRWRTLPKKAGLQRCGKSCRLRWMNYLRPDVKRGYISPDEEDLILRLHRLLGNRWSLIAGRIPGRTDNEIKNYWNTHLSKQLISQGIDPRTHRPLSHPNLQNPNSTNATEGSTDKSDTSTVKRNSDLVELTNSQHSDHLRVRKRHKPDINEIEALRGSATTAAIYQNKQSDQIFDWKYHFKAGGVVGEHHLLSSTFAISDSADRQSFNTPYLEALEPGLLNHGFSPFFINNPAPATTAFDIQSIQNMCADHCNQISNNAPTPSINKIQFNEYDGNMLASTNFDRRYHLPKAEVFLDTNCTAISNHNNGVQQIFFAPSSNQDSYGPYLDSAVQEDLLLSNFNTSSSTTSISQPLQLRLEPENPNSNACDLWSLYQYHHYT